MSRRVAVLAAALALGGAGRPGVAPDTPWTCPDSHPVKGYASAESGRRVYHLPGSPFYDEASPERCYADEAEARRDGSRPAPDPRRRRAPDDFAGSPEPRCRAWC